MKFKQLVILFVLSATASIANAALITSNTLTNTSTVDFSQFAAQQSVGGGVQVGSLVGEDIMLTALGDNRVGPMNHSLGTNGSWRRSGVLNNDTNGYFEFTFNDGPVSAIGGFMNYAPGYGNFVLSVYGAGNTLLESYDISALAPISTPNGVDAGAFRGIERNTADIYSVRLSSTYAVIDDFTFTRDAVDVAEPSALVLMGLGLTGLGFVRRRKS